jgi:hypothetical protein
MEEKPTFGVSLSESGSLELLLFVPACSALLSGALFALPASQHKH